MPPPAAAGGAEAALEQAVAIEPDEAPLRSALAKVHADAGRTRRGGERGARSWRRCRACARSQTTDRLEERRRARGAGPGRRRVRGAGRDLPDCERPIACRSIAWRGSASCPCADWRSQVRAWLLPQSSTSAALEAAAARRLRRALRDRRGAARVPEEVEASLASVRAFGTERADVALVNDVLDIDACVVARFAPAEAEALFDAAGRRDRLEVRLASGRQSDAVSMLGVTGDAAGLRASSVQLERARGRRLRRPARARCCSRSRAAGAASSSCSTTSGRAARRASSASSCRAVRARRSTSASEAAARNRAATYQRKARGPGRATRSTWSAARRACAGCRRGSGTWRCTGCSRTPPRRR